MFGNRVLPSFFIGHDSTSCLNDSGVLLALATSTVQTQRCIPFACHRK
jgi:hypothetical protein